MGRISQQRLTHQPSTTFHSVVDLQERGVGDEREIYPKPEMPSKHRKIVAP
jgi:hypothetical protein